MTSEAGGAERALLLIVDDDPADVELIQAALAHSDIECRVDSVDTLQGVRDHLDRNRYDVALVDYNLRGWRGIEVVAELRSRGLDTPLILVSGTIGEERVVDCLREGATDYVLKGNLARLPHAVRRALDDAHLRTERAAAQRQIERLSIAVDQGPAAVMMTDTMGRIEYVNSRFTDITGYTEEEALGANPRILRSGRTQQTYYEDMWRTIVRGDAWRGEILNRRKNGDLFWCLSSISPIRGPDGVVTHFVAVQEDVSERRWAQEAIREREERLRQIAESIHEVFFIVDVDFSETLFISPAYENVWGRSCRSVYEDPRSFMDALHPDDRPALIGSITRVRAGEEAGAIEFRVVHPTGEERWVRAHASPVLDESGEVYRIAGVALDITERKSAEERLRESEERYRMLTDASFDAIVLTVEGVVRDVNPGFRALLGYEAEEALGMSALDLVAEESKAEVGRRITEGIDGNYELVLLHEDGRRVLCEATAKTHAVEGRPGRVTALRDVRETRALEEQLRQAQKLEAVGRLAGGVAHDFNNVLTVILTEVQLLRLSGEAERNEAVAESLREIEAAGKRAAGLTRQLLTFSRRDVVELEVLDPRGVVEGLQKMLARLIGEDVRMEVSVADSIGTVRIDRGQLEQVIVNLVVNARDAMPEGGDLRIEVADVVLDEEYARAHAEVEAGPHVLVAVSDTGTGMTAEVRERLFEPFFTTKPVGKGTGLGLATSYGIVRDVGGHIAVYSEPGVGTTMKVYLPIVAETAMEARPPAVEPMPSSGSGTVLVVEDDDAVRRNAVRALERVGYRVLQAPNGAAALRVLEDNLDEIDLIFTDVVMPGLSGPDLALRAQDLVPGIRVLYATGYTADMALRHRLVGHMDTVLPKPYTPDDLYLKVRSMLGR